MRKRKKKLIDGPPSQCPPLRAAVEALDRFSAMKEELCQQATAHEGEMRSWRHKVSIALADIENLQTRERKLSEKLHAAETGLRA
jgi:hypothetical protein